VRYAHDLYRESIYAAGSPGLLVDLHARVAAALVRRHERGSGVFSAELARHFAAAVPLAGAAPALAWARSAAAADASRFAFAEGAGHLARARSAIADAGLRLPDAELVELFSGEAELRLRAGDVDQARTLLDLAWGRAAATADPELIGIVALGLERVGARFAMPRTELIAVLETARQALVGSATPIEAQVIAALARQLQHSVPDDRPRARPLADQAVEIARTLDDPATLANCLLAQHDTMWTPGTAPQRARIASEMGELAEKAADPERQVQALLLTATAQLESGSPAFRATFAEYAYRTERLRQPRHEYLLRTRQAALALLDGDIGRGERLSLEAAALGEAVGDTDTGNVLMSQRLEVVRARGDAAELRATAADAVRWWIGAPAHAHAVAAGFYARAGDLDRAASELATVLALPDWRTDRSYLWSIFAGELVVAATALDDRPVCRQLLDDLLPIADTCAVNGALVCFMGAHAHRVGLLYAALGQPDSARHWLDRAVTVHRGLGAALWEAETCTMLATLAIDDPQPYARRASELRTRLGLAAGAAGPTNDAEDEDEEEVKARLTRIGGMWQASFLGQVALLRDVKGLRDLATLLARPGDDVPALELMGVAGSAHARHPGDDPALDRRALEAYRRRLAELDADIASATSAADLARRERYVDEREQLLAYLRRETRPGGRSRDLGVTVAERARKAVTARIRDAIRRIADVHPALGAHLDRTVHTGTTCRYDPGPRRPATRSPADR
jgi:tetratricopeptide (TPR) repeat protein